MKILQVNKFYYPKRGADKYFLFLEQLLRQRGHEVRVFAMKSKNNLKSPDSSYFSKEVNLQDNSLKNKIKASHKIIYNFEAKKQFTRLLADFKPDIIHCHNIYHQLSPSILDAALKAKIPVVMHLHDYKLICPNYKLYTGGKYCQRCKPQKYGQCLKNRCVENSLAKSLLAVIEMTIHHRWLRIYKRGIKFFIAPSFFMKNICLDFGWPEKKFKVLENISPQISVLKNEDVEKYFLYFGALEEEKGVDLLLRAAADSHKKVKIAGSGQMEQELKDLAQKLNISVDFLGQLSGGELQNVITKALAVVIPSRWPENMPLTAIEAMSLAKTVIAADIGGLSELIKSGETGYLFPPQNWKALSKYLKELTPEKAKQIGQAAALSRQRKTEDWHYQELIKIYQEVVNKKEL